MRIDGAEIDIKWLARKELADGPRKRSRFLEIKVAENSIPDNFACGQDEEYTRGSAMLSPMAHLLPNPIFIVSVPAPNEKQILRIIERFLDIWPKLRAR